MADVERIEYRFALPSDEAAIAELHADSWRRTFRGLVSDRYLDEDVTKERADVWRRRFADPDRGTRTITIVARQRGELVGFIHSVLDEDPVWGTLLDNLHVRYGYHGRGIARRLIATSAAVLQERGRNTLYLSVLRANDRARTLYEALGGRLVETSVWDSPGGVAVPNLLYAWSDLTPLLGQTSGR